ncbi:MAG TPA: phage tail tape measure protein [Microbacterium sp.]|nr:phage tail tape measure protein [Microbacterium sp.]
MFDAGALVFKLQTVGAQVFKQDQADAKAAVEKTGQASKESADKVTGLGTATDATGKKAKAAKGPLDEQAASTKKVGDESDNSSKKQDKQKYSTEQQIAAAKELSKVLLIAGAAAAAMVTLAVAKNTEFDQAMSQTRAATMATAAEQKKLGEAALDAGADTAYSASEAAAAEEELAKAGLSVSNIVGGSLNGALALAAAGQLQVARSAEIMATTLTQFGLTADKSGHVADVLAAGAGKAQGEVEDLALALTYVGPLAKSAGWSLEETGGTLAYFASQGILGEKAGTSLRGVLAALQAPSTIAAKTMDQYGLSVYDAHGKMLSASQMAAQLQHAFGGLTDQERNAAMGRIFGNESLTAATLLYNGGAQAISKWTDEVNDSGFAAEQAAMRQDNLAGDIEKLGGAFDTALIRTGSNANDVLRAMVQNVTMLVDMYGDAPEPVQALGLVLGVATAAILLFAGGAVGARAKFVELKATLDATNASMGKTALVGGAAGLALTGIIAVVGLLMSVQAEGRQIAESYADAIDASTGKVTKAARDIAVENLSKAGAWFTFNWQSAYDAADKLGLSLDTVTDAALGNKKALAELDIYLRAAEEDHDALNQVVEKTGLSQQDALFAVGALKTGIDQQNNALKEGKKLHDQKSRAEDEATEVTQTATEAYLDQAGSIDKLQKQLSDLIDTINKANGVNQDAITSNIDYQETLRTVDEQIAKIKSGADGYARSLDITTKAGSDNKAMLVELAQKAWDAAEAQLQLDGNTDGFTSRLEASRQKLYDTAIAMGATDAEAAALRDSILAIPSKKEIQMIADTASAQNRIDQFVRLNNGRTVRVHVAVDGSQSYRVGSKTVDSGFANGALVQYNANGNFTPSEHHVAQMLRGGAIRVWNEPETQGETYVPHAMSKRSRSEAIMAATAELFGGVYIPAGAKAFADGGGVSVGPSGGADVVALLRMIAAKLDRPNLSIVNPVSRDAKSDAWEAAQIVGL